MFSKIKEFLGPIEESVKGQLHRLEIYRASILGAISWLIVCLYTIGSDLVIEAMKDVTLIEKSQNLVKLLIEKNYSAIAIGVTGFVIDIVRRKYFHGQDNK